jgi:putative heme-binding domain-containing protein
MRGTAVVDDILPFHSMRMARYIAALLLAVNAASAQSAGERPPSTPEDLAAGERLYRTQCSYCHGPRGEGGRGAALARPHLLHAPNPQAMFAVIEEGISGTEMPGHWFIPRETWQIVAFVESLGQLPPQQIAGDPAHGQAVYSGKGACASCHTVNGRGGALGPDLTDIGAVRSPSYLRESLLEPEAAVPDGFLQVEVVTRDGRRIQGVRVNEDTFSIQIRDLAGNFHSYFRTELQKIHKQPGKSPMPSYKSALTPGELDDLIAYLDSLRGNP